LAQRRHRPATRLSKTRATQLRTQFDTLGRNFSAGVDPIDFVHRYSDHGDQEVAAVLASALAFGRVSAFSPVLSRLFELADAAGGPARWAHLAIDQTDSAIEPLFYRWVRGPDLSRFLRTIGRVRQLHGSIQALVEGSHSPKDTDIGPSLCALVDAMREQSLSKGETSYGELSRGYRHLLPHPSQGSACKRWCMFARWMTRTGSPDLGLWAVPTHKLVIPLDTHIHRVAQMVGLTRRTDGSWRTALEITQNLRRIDADDPTRYDFVLAHLGIDGQCKARHIPEICGSCSLVNVCKIGQSG
jgi:uncharacterized protein (TIGR02757 family)